MPPSNRQLWVDEMVLRVPGLDPAEARAFARDVGEALREQAVGGQQRSRLGLVRVRMALPRQAHSAEIAWHIARRIAEMIA
jgi:hypothetical protein